MQRLLVTGGAGFIGSCFIRQAMECHEVEILNLDKLTYAGDLDSLGQISNDPRYTFVHGDIAEHEMVAGVIEGYRPDAILHFAAESHVDRSIDDPDAFLRTNVFGTHTLLGAALRYWRNLPDSERQRWRFIHVSTDEVYGSLGPDDAPFTEFSRYAPNSPYSASKASADHFARAYFHTYGLPVIVTNCSNNYGPYQFPEKLIPLMILNALEGRPLPVYGDGGNVRDWLFVDDHCAALSAVLDRGRPGEVYNIGGHSEHTNIEIVRTICALVGELRPDLSHTPCESLIAFVEDRPGHDRRYAVDATKIRSELGWRPRHSFAEGLRQTVQWYLANPQWIERITSGVYRRERLGLAARRE